MKALGKLNFRDLGGIAAPGGKMRHGLVYRSEGPASFNEFHHAELADLGIRLVCDLRSEEEQRTKPNDWAEQARFLSLDVLADLRNKQNGGWEKLMENPTVQGAREAMIYNYQVIPAALQPHLREFTDLLVGGTLPALIHCAAGKDRTGVLVALLLRMINAQEADIMHDYMQSARFGQNPANLDIIRGGFQRRLGFAPADEVLMPIIGVEPDYLAAAFEAIDELSGSLEAYFAGAGIDDAKRDALARLLLE